MGALSAASTVTPGSSTPIVCFSGITVVEGGNLVPTTFEPNTSLTSTPSPLVTFIGNDTSAGGSTLDLADFADAMSDTITV
jgi:hypothetical protein